MNELTKIAENCDGNYGFFADELIEALKEKMLEVSLKDAKDDFAIGFYKAFQSQRNELIDEAYRQMKEEK